MAQVIDRNASGDERLVVPVQRPWMVNSAVTQHVIRRLLETLREYLWRRSSTRPTTSLRMFQSPWCATHGIARRSVGGSRPGRGCSSARGGSALGSGQGVGWYRLDPTR